MKFAVLVLACVAVASGQYNSGRYNSYTTKRPQFQYQPYQPYSTLAPFVVSTSAPVYAPVQVAKVVSDARSAETLRNIYEIYPDGSYNYAYETQNGISAQAQGTPRNLGGNPPAIPDVVQGSFSFTSPEGVPISITYEADENGYRPQGAALPTPPPLPPQIARALEYIAKYSPVQKK